jgi:primosomal protein N'
MKNRIAEVALPISIALNQEFDYLIPEDLDPPVSIGCRVLVPFRTSVILGYVTKLKKYSPFEKKLRPIAKNFDRIPILNAELLEIAHKIQENYFCSYADSIESVIPIGLKKLHRSLPKIEDIVPEPRTPTLPLQELEPLVRDIPQSKVVLIHDLSNQKRWDINAALIKKTLNEKKSVIFLVPDN